MSSIYFVRHGESKWNVANKICGKTDIELTDKGRDQARATAKRIINEGVKVSHIIYSPLCRAAETAKIISEATGIKAFVEPRLIEQNFGKYEGTARDGYEFKESKKQFATDYEGGESMLKLAQRIYNLLDELKEKDEDVIIVAHNGIARVVNSYFNSMTNEEYASFGVENCSLRRFDFEEESK